LSLRTFPNSPKASAARRPHPWSRPLPAVSGNQTQIDIPYGALFRRAPVPVSITSSVDHILSATRHFSARSSSDESPIAKWVQQRRHESCQVALLRVLDWAVLQR